VQLHERKGSASEDSWKNKRRPPIRKATLTAKSSPMQRFTSESRLIAMMPMVTRPDGLMIKAGKKEASYGMKKTASAPLWTMALPITTFMMQGEKEC
jgi:hypothetical protein